MEALILRIHLPQIAYIILQLLVQIRLEQEPVDLTLLAPLSLLTEFLAHEEKLLARVTHHICIACTQVVELVLIDARHLAPHGALQMNDLIV